ncbi:hypothetical protein [Bartonella florencae]|uniref:hypothetical protein n=1 Tax=Bartonella florencae TaxID=928210 RepID=UPI000319D333|nr:hypothetical protein [Bartonella florencae]
MKQDAEFEQGIASALKKAFLLSRQDYRRIFHISALMVTVLVVIGFVYQIMCGRGFISFFLLEPLAWVFGIALFFLPTVLLFRTIVSRKLQKIIQELEEI